MSNRDFGIRIPDMFATGFRGYRDNVVPLTLAGVATLAVFSAIQFPIDQLIDDGSIWAARFLNAVALWVAAVVAYPWFYVALGAADGVTPSLNEAFAEPKRFAKQAVASFWFVAAVILGIQYLRGIPALLVLVLYAFYSYVIADGGAKGGMEALGTSVRMTEGRRIGLFAVEMLFLLFVLVGALPLGFGTNPLTFVLAGLGLVITSSIALVAGGAVYRVFRDDLAEKDRKAPTPKKAPPKKKKRRNR
ncbi:MAG: hypothetical protein ACR2P0_06720 [Acidimicrobiales bacterium]